MGTACAQLIVLDIDGTIVVPGETLNPELSLLLKELRDEGQLLVTTGRHPQGVRFLLEREVGFVPAICLNGGSIHLKSWSEFDMVAILGTQEVMKMTSILDAYDVTVSYYGKEFWAVSRRCDLVHKEAEVTGIDPVDWRKELSEACIKVCVMGDDTILWAVSTDLHRAFGDTMSVARSNPQYLEISRGDGQKRKSFEFVLRSLFEKRGVTPRAVFVGDSENDIEWARLADEAWTFSTASAKLKTVCKGILPLDNGPGLVAFLEGLKRERRNKMDKTIAVVTGGSSGLGFEVSRRLVERGINICIVGRDASRLSQAASQLKLQASESAVMTFQANVGNEAQVKLLFEQLKEEGYRVDIVFNVAGVGLFGDVERTSRAMIDEVMEANLVGLILMSAFAVGKMKESGGTIVNIMSTAALVGREKEAVYCAAKWGARGFTEALKAATKNTKVRVVAVFPGGMRTPFWTQECGLAPDVSKFMDPSDVAGKIVALGLSTDSAIASDVTINRAG